MLEIEVIKPQGPAFPQVQSLIDTRTALVKCAGNVTEFQKAYAGAMCFNFDLCDNQGNVTTKWFDLKGKLKAGVKKEKALFVQDMVQAGYVKVDELNNPILKDGQLQPSGTVDVYWQRVKEFSGYVTKGNKAKAELDTNDKIRKYLTTALNLMFKGDEAGEDIILMQFEDEMKDIFTACGGEWDNLG